MSRCSGQASHFPVRHSPAPAGRSRITAALAGFAGASKRGHLSVQTSVDIFVHRHASQTPCRPARMPFEQFSPHPGHSESANTRRYTLHPDAAGEVLQTGTAYLACTVKPTQYQRSARRAEIFLSDADDRPKLWHVEYRLGSKYVWLKAVSQADRLWDLICARRDSNTKPSGQ